MDYNLKKLSNEIQESRHELQSYANEKLRSMNRESRDGLTDLKAKVAEMNTALN